MGSRGHLSQQNNKTSCACYRMMWCHRWNMKSLEHSINASKGLLQLRWETDDIPQQTAKCYLYYHPFVHPFISQTVYISKNSAHGVIYLYSPQRFVYGTFLDVFLLVENYLRNRLGENSSMCFWNKQLSIDKIIVILSRRKYKLFRRQDTWILKSFI